MVVGNEVDEWSCALRCVCVWVVVVRHGGTAAKMAMRRATVWRSYVFVASINTIVTSATTGSLSMSRVLRLPVKCS